LKKILSCLLIIFCILSCVACTKKEEKNSKENSFELKNASTVVDSYMSFIMNGDYGNGKKLYTKKLFKETSNMPISDIKIKGFKVIESIEVGNSGVFKVRVARTSMVNSLACLDEYSIKIIQEGKKYKINEIISSPQKEAFAQSIGIRYRDKKDVKTNLIIDESGIPKYSYSKDDAARLYKIVVPLKKFTSINFNYEGDKLALSTYDKNSFIGIVSIDESLAVQGSGGSPQGQPSQGGGGGSEEIAKEKPIGKELVQLDLLMNCKVEFMTFSLDEKFLVVQYTKEDKDKYINIYSVDNGEMVVPVDFKKNYPIEKFQLAFSSFGDDTMYYEVTSKANNKGAKSNDKGSKSNIIGKWKLDLKSFKANKLK